MDEQQKIDEISVNILKYCGDAIVSSITSIINNSIGSGIFPDELKKARVRPIFKSGDSEVTANYRPISILPILSKIIERHIADQMQEYFKLTDIIYKYQSGFRKYHSCSTALTILIDSWLKDIDNGSIIGTVYFDLVDHEILLYKMKLYNFSENTRLFFKSYLTNRTQLVQIGKKNPR